MPKETLVRSAYVYHLAREAAQFGVSTGGVAVDWAKVIERKDEIVRRLEAVKGTALEERGISVLRNRATFASSHELALDGRRVGADKVILAVGSKVGRPPVPGIELAITSDEALDMRELPESVVIIGGGVIAIEFAHIWNTVGVKVTVLEMEKRILGPVDEDVAEELARLSAERGIEIHTGTRVERVSRVDGGLAVYARSPDGEREIRAATVLLAAGRVPNTEGMGLEKVGVRVEKKGIVTNEYLQTAAAGIYSGGDADGGFFLTPVASYEGRLAARNALEGNVEKADYRLVTSTVFTRPPASSVGLTEPQARAKGVNVLVSRLPFTAIGRAVVEGETEGFVKIVEDVDSGEILGAHLLGARSEELVHEFAIAMEGNLTRQRLARIFSIHPSFSEGVIGAALSAETGHTESCCG